MKVPFFLAAVACCSLPSFAQHQMSISLNSGPGRSALITDFDAETGIQSHISDKHSTSYNAQLQYAFQKNHWIAETGLAYNLVQGSTRETFHVYNLFNEYEYHTYAAHETRRAHYLSVPLMVRYSFDKLSIGAGVYAATLLTDYSLTRFYLNDMPNGFQQGGNRLKRLDLGLNAKVHFALNNRFGLQALINYGLTDASNGNQYGAIYQLFQLNKASNRELKNRQFLLGISYRLF